ncbi:uncharacterized protein BT62DRAFT_116018 [Guyanagaster necrorhizus]|uniref:Uncharacterized protein n=1 Tax=Guyanagaster necrorhizus TaxID=856835 RepID=A0A9P8ASG7_9AGAR|nr:uncharacterized protein BT62DRAFT_116018 [Guyanagaster necrorhizus MCA 3950]KAG7446388.1 hypothetical protein BT62DRAFT_116018 [Guyanagaster necrorhizus MCA 3950]
MSLNSMSNFAKRKSSLCPTNGRLTVGDGASFSLDTDPSVLAVCQMQGTDDLYYYSTTFSGGPGVSFLTSTVASGYSSRLLVALLTSLIQNALQTEGRRTV